MGRKRKRVRRPSRRQNYSSRPSRQRSAQHSQPTLTRQVRLVQSGVQSRADVSQHRIEEQTTTLSNSITATHHRPVHAPPPRAHRLFARACNSVRRRQLTFQPPSAHFGTSGAPTGSVASIVGSFRTCFDRPRRLVRRLAPPAACPVEIQPDPAAGSPAAASLDASWRRILRRWALGATFTPSVRHTVPCQPSAATLPIFTSFACPSHT